MKKLVTPANVVALLGLLTWVIQWVDRNSFNAGKAECLIESNKNCDEKFAKKYAKALSENVRYVVTNDFLTEQLELCTTKRDSCLQGQSNL